MTAGCDKQYNRFRTKHASSPFNIASLFVSERSRHQAATYSQTDASSSHLHTVSQTDAPDGMKPTAKTELRSLQYNRAAGFVLLLSVVLILEGVSRCNLQIGTPAGSWTGTTSISSWPQQSLSVSIERGGSTYSVNRNDVSRASRITAYTYVSSVYLFVPDRKCMPV